MRSSSLSLLLFVIACSGNSLKVGSDGSGGSGDDGSGGTRPAGGTNGSGGSSRGGAAGSDIDKGGTSSGDSGAAGTSVSGAAGASIGGTGGVGGTGGSMPSGPPITSCTDEFPFAGEWRGSILDFFFEPLEDLRLSVRADDGGAGGYVGELTWGSGDPPAPATDPDAPYPENFDADAGVGGARGAGDKPWPGYAYTVVRGAGCDATFRVSVSTRQGYESWCALQTPIEGSDGTFGCMMRGNGGSFDGTTCNVTDESGRIIADYPAWRCALCGFLGGSVCSCDARSCNYNAEPTHVFNLTLNADGNVLSGPDATCPDCTVRLDRITR